MHFSLPLRVLGGMSKYWHFRRMLFPFSFFFFVIFDSVVFQSQNVTALRSTSIESPHVLLQLRPMILRYDTRAVANALPAGREFAAAAWL